MVGSFCIADVGLTHAEIVIPVVSDSDAACCTVTQLLSPPVKPSAFPKRPVVQVALESVPINVLPPGAAFAVVIPVPSSKP